MTLIYCFSISAHLCIHSVEKVQIGIKGHCQGQGVIESQSQAIKSKLLRRLCVWKGFLLFKLDETQTLVSWTFAFQFV